MNRWTADRVVRALVQVACAAGLLGTFGASAQVFPDKPLRVIVPFPTGGLVDSTMRIVGQQVSESIGQPVLVENRPGASTFIGMQACARAPADGYTLCISTPDSLSYNPHLFSSLPYDPENDFVGVTNLVVTNNLIVAHASAPFGTFREMIAYARANPGKVDFGTWGVGSIPHVYLEAIKKTFGVDITAVPYKGAGQAFPAILAGEVQATYGGLGFSMPHIRAGKLKALAATPDASPLLPSIPTLQQEGAEPGLPSYFGIYAPARTPPAVLDRLASEFAKALRTPKIQDFLVTQTLVGVGNSPAEFAAYLKADRANSQRVFRAMGLKPNDAP